VDSGLCILLSLPLVSCDREGGNEKTSPLRSSALAIAFSL